MGYVRGIFDRAKVIWQIAELGKVDAGGGGTVAMYMANRNITTLDAGVPVGVNAFDPDQAARYAGAGAAFVGLGSDAGVLLAGVGALAERA